MRSTVMRSIETTSFVTDEQRWAAIAARDRAADGAFVYAVRTTGIYCRPWCPSRRPNRANVALFDTHAAAEGAGFRACKRCTPQLAVAEPAHAAAVVRACKQIEEAEREPTLRELAGAAGLSPFHFQRLFKAAVGVTPKQYALARRQQRLRELLRNDARVTDAMLDAGFESSGRAYAHGAGLLGMTPGEYQRGAPGAVMSAAVVRCSLGWALVAATELGVCAIEFGDDAQELRARLRERFPGAELREGEPAFEALLGQVLQLIETPRATIELPLDIRGTAFQRRVWEALRSLRAGETVSYGQLAARIGSPTATRAVAQACGANTLAVAIPCHRVVRGDGELGGYRWGVERKRTLLEREEITDNR